MEWLDSAFFFFFLHAVHVMGIDRKKKKKFALFLQSGLLFSPRKLYFKVIFSVLLICQIIHEKEKDVS